ncbi:hypothetical protein RJ55_02120 [Drechmeria coniospora]|nr:hypothetical protein RJ55_02120 [Drechmeria coniospora]
MVRAASPSSSSARGGMHHADVESGYASGHSDDAPLPKKGRPKVSLTREHMDFLNDQMEPMHPMDILRFCTILFPDLYQSTAFGLTGLATLDMLCKIRRENSSLRPVGLIFLDTLYHFPETHELVARVRERYPDVPVHVFKPDGVDTVEELEETYGAEMWRTAGDMYDWIVKVEPLQRAYDELRVAAVVGGRRRSQGAARESMPILELDDERGIIKINPMATWSFSQVRDYVRENAVPYNALLDRGYKSVGDWHSTSPVEEGEDERAGRWKGQAKTECGIHNRRSRYEPFADGAKEKKSVGQVVPPV